MLGSVRVRFAPSPTGFLHLGGLRTALFNYLFARHTGGQFVLRIEDTDQARTVPGATEHIINALDWAGIRPDEGPGIGGAYKPYIQSERRFIYQSIAKQLIDKHAAYRCFCTSDQLQHRRNEAIRAGRSTAYDRHCMHLTEQDVTERIRLGTPFTVRLRIPSEQISVQDTLYGNLNFHHTTQEDSILLKSNGMPTYHLANVVDDHFMNISHVMRGEEWLPSTPKHLILYRAMDWSPPTFVHLPLLLNTDHTKLSKRCQHADVRYYQEHGYLPETVVNFVALLGWSPKSTQELFTMDQLIEQFSLTGLNRSGAVVAHDKLDWLSKQHLLKKCNEHDVASLIEQIRKHLPDHAMSNEMIPIDTKDNSYLERVLYTSKERITTIKDITTRFAFFFNDPDLKSNEAEAFAIELGGKDSIVLVTTQLVDCFKTINVPLMATDVKKQLKQFSSTSNIAYGKLLRVLRYALTGTKIGPDIIETICTLGKDTVLQRIKQLN
ncbi:glutamyl-tRNA synthetase [Syncephalis fuscata]|nr:glutamyl-tRNA synthetase [Syncephalis fuscata]